MLLAVVAMAMLKRHRTLNFLDVLFNKIATLEHSERCAIDKHCDDLVQQEKKRHAEREAEVCTQPHYRRRAVLLCLT